MGEFKSVPCSRRSKDKTFSIEISDGRVLCDSCDSDQLAMVKI